MNVHYQAGRRYEYQVRRRYERAGYICLRAAGSHGNWDIIALSRTEPKVILIQCKKVKDKATATRMAKEFCNNPPPPDIPFYIRKMLIWVPRVTEIEAVVDQPEHPYTQRVGDEPV